MNAAASMSPIQVAAILYALCAVVSLFVASIINLLFIAVKKQKKISFSIIKSRHKKAMTKEEAAKPR